jgi:hypothetical protein
MLQSWKIIYIVIENLILISNLVFQLTYKSLIGSSFGVKLLFQYLFIKLEILILLDYARKVIHFFKLAFQYCIIFLLLFDLFT